MSTLTTERPVLADTQASTASALRFITCGSVDDGKSTLIGRLLLDSRSVLQDQLAHVTHQASGQINAAELARLTDGLQAEREQGITIDVAWRYFATPQRKFIIGDAPGHEQYTRNMVTAASQADCAVVLVDATKLAWAATGDGDHALLPQTRRHALLAQLLRVPHIVFAINKLDAVADASAVYARIRSALQTFADEAGLDVRAIIPVSALTGWNVVDRHADWAGYQGPALLELLEQLPREPHATQLPAALPVQWVESNAASSDTDRSRRVLWGRIAEGTLQPGDSVQVFPSGQHATVVQLLDHGRRPLEQAAAPASTGVILDRELDISRGDWLLAAGCRRPASAQPVQRHHRLARYRAAAGRPRLLGPARSPLDQGQGHAHHAPARHPHAADTGGQPARRQRHRPGRTDAAGSDSAAALRTQPQPGRDDPGRQRQQRHRCRAADTSRGRRRLLNLDPGQKLLQHPFTA